MGVVIIFFLLIQNLYLRYIFPFLISISKNEIIRDTISKTKINRNFNLDSLSETTSGDLTKVSY